jgi:hydroxylamine dehydrogenase
MSKWVLWALMVILALCLLPLGPAAEAQDESCRACHAGPAADFDRSSKAAHLSCTDCHGDEHNGPDTGEPGIPTPKTCQKCHEEQVEHFNQGKHYYGWEALEAVPVYENMPGAVTEKGCEVCHKVGYVWEDGSQGRCDSCHSRHLFSAEEARKPEACGTCHAGDHPHFEMWAGSKHGMIYAMEGDSGRAPTCVTCHGSHNVLTAWGFLGLREGDEDDPEWSEARAKVKKALEIMGPAQAPEIMRATYEEWEAAREEMVARCTECHSESYARRDLEKGDALLREADIAKARIIDVADMLYDDGLIDDMTRFGMYREATSHRFAAFMGGFHGSPNHAWDEGYLELVSGAVAARDGAIVQKKLSVIQGKLPQFLGFGIAGVVGLVIALVAVALVFWFRHRYLKAQKPVEE